MWGARVTSDGLLKDSARGFSAKELMGKKSGQVAVLPEGKPNSTNRDSGNWLMMSKSSIRGSSDSGTTT